MIVFTEYVARMEGSGSTFRISICKPTGRRPLGRPRHWWVKNVRIDLKIDIFHCEELDSFASE